MNEYLDDLLDLLRAVAEENAYPDGEFHSCSVGRPSEPAEIPPGTPAPLAHAAVNLVCGYGVALRPLADPGRYPVAEQLNAAAGIADGADYR
ncbi:hypothetical protein [Kitasatospora camelliae]|uniref:Uncharacterized protein n=1 Tax=Kitasatospora camelliae TaxID=3156397 RepID=A0AAU8JY26_9ACTN